MRLLTMKYGRVVLFAMILSVVLAGVYLLLGVYQSLDVTGGCDQRSSPYLNKYYDDQRIITYCKRGYSAY